MLFGWAGWGRSRIYNEWGQDASVTDSWWVITFGVNGIFGLVSGTLVLLLPVILFILYYPAKTWSHPKIAPAAALSLILVSYMIDNLLNAITMPVFVLGVGALSGLLAKELEADQLGENGVNLSVGDNFLAEQLQEKHYLLNQIQYDKD